MDTRLSAIQSIWRSLVAAVVALTLVIALGAARVSAAPPACRVRNTDSGKTYTALQAAVDAARKGGHLTVRGTCQGTTVIDKGLLIEGLGSAPMLDGDRKGVVLTIRKGVTATIRELAIEGGRGHFREGGPKDPFNWPAGVENRGNLTFRGVIVRRNQGVGIENAGRLRLNGDTVVGVNTSPPGEFVYPYTLRNKGRLTFNGSAQVRQGKVEDLGILVMNGTSRLYRTQLAVRASGRAILNDASHISGEYSTVSNDGVLILNDDSRLQGPGAPGVFNSGSLTLAGRSRISGYALGVINGRSRSQLGTFVMDGSMTLQGASSVDGNGAGVFNYGSLTLNGSSSIHDNHRGAPSKCAPDCGPIGGGGVFNSGSLVLNDSSTITGNSVAAWHLGSYGGGVYMIDDTYAPAASLTMTGSATISGNSAGDQGGGVYVGLGSVVDGVMCGSQTLANVTGNSPDDCYIEP